MQRIYELVGEFDGVFTVRTLISFLGYKHHAGAWVPMLSDGIAYGEKTCWVTSEEGFEFSAPIVVVLAGVRDGSSCAMMLLPLGEVGAHGLAAEATLDAARL